LFPNWERKVSDKLFSKALELETKAIETGSKRAQKYANFLYDI